jgi:hypothetical protein
MKLPDRARYCETPLDDAASHPRYPIYVITLGAKSGRHTFLEPSLTALIASNAGGKPVDPDVPVYLVDDSTT